MNNGVDTSWANDFENQPVTPPKPAQQWLPGQYEGEFQGHELVSSQTKGTPGIRLWFSVKGRVISVDLWITENAMRIAAEQLLQLGWNGEYGDTCEFTQTEQPVKLYLKHEDYKGKTQERWSISTFRPPPSTTDGGIMAQFAARAKQIAAERANPLSAKAADAPQTPW